MFVVKLVFIFVVIVAAAAVVVVVVDNSLLILLRVRCLESVIEVENWFGGRIDMPSLDMSCRIVDPREWEFVSSLTILAAINGTMIP